MTVLCCRWVPPPPPLSSLSPAYRSRPRLLRTHSHQTAVGSRGGGVVVEREVRSKRISVVCTRQLAGTIELRRSVRSVFSFPTISFARPNGPYYLYVSVYTGYFFLPFHFRRYLYTSYDRRSAQVEHYR